MIIALFAASAMTATPVTAQRVVDTARPGAMIRLAPGDYGRLTIKNRQWKQPITIDAKAATLKLAIIQSDGVILRGGTFSGAMGAGGEGYAILLRQARRISFESPTMRASMRGLVIDRSSDVRVTRATITDMRIDGINIASSQRVTVTDSSCSNFDTGEAHPDCIQMWSRPDRGITQDVTLLRNRSVGKMQGFTGFNHVRNGVNDGGFDRITIKDSFVAGEDAPRGIFLGDCRDCVVTGNRAQTLPGARWMETISVENCTRCTVNDNQNGDRPARRPPTTTVPDKDRRR
ncbi:right-handed parallel beta-helix repeat-containing protein [Sphingobium sp. CAP-1]|uniref:right-handed parallel beta-helix repeat-containing protein n=1 Tax=Sphingobium sp. CAP-1 TaxID=2676077 RepID=UPI0012BB31A6|nr:right-handed parallel beta-helix repeat-containing protein [Sphingobium sp. CAP-1]QGP78195.1 hypothetical protein GL174_03685 [Sphingobium sp. CAP-1]